MTLFLVFGSYNPDGRSYVHWAILPLAANPGGFTVFKALVGTSLLAAWVIFLRTTYRSLGRFGLGLALAFFLTLIWLLSDWGLVVVESMRGAVYLIETVLCAVLAVGISWPQIRQRLREQRNQYGR